MKLVVIGANGQLGSDVVAAFSANGDDVAQLTHSDIEVADLDSISRALRDLRPHVVVNTAAMHHVEPCEREPEKAFAVNALGPRNLAVVTRQSGRGLMHVSTDYVFERSKESPYGEDDAARPMYVQGVDIIAAEHI